MRKSIKLTAPSHRWYFEKSFSNSERYERFINWLSAEFYFSQQEQGPLFIIYFPNGKVMVRKTDGFNTSCISQITIDSKCHSIGAKIKMKLTRFLDFMDHYNRLNQA